MTSQTNILSDRRKRRSVIGISLVELLVGLALGIGVLGMIIKVFANARLQFQVADSHARIQENARQALQFLKDDILMAGHVGVVQQFWFIQETGNNSRQLGNVTGECFTAATNNFRWANPFPRDTETSIPPRLFGQDNNYTQFTGCIANGNNHVDNTDVLSVHYAGTPGVANNQVGDDDEAFYLRSNLRGGVVFTCGMGMKGMGMGGVTGGGASCLQNAVGPGAMLPAPYTASLLWNTAAAPDPPTSPETNNYILQSFTYYIRPCTDPGADGNCSTADDGDTTPALVRARLEYNADSACPGRDPCVVHEPIAEGVVSMQLEYGIDRREAAAVTGNLGNALNSADFYDGNVDQYVAASHANVGGGRFDTAASWDLWSRVLTVRVWLLIRSPVAEAGYQGPSTYTVAGQAVPVDTRFRHQLFTTTVAIRNLTALGI